MRRVLVHPMLARAAFWRGVARPEDVLVELPGHGAAPPPGAGEVYLHAAAARIAAALPEGPVHLVGLSFGAVAALAHAARGGRTAALTLIEPVLFAAAAGTAEGAANARASEGFEAALARGDRPEAARLFHGLWGAGAWDDLPPPLRADLAAGMAWVEASAPGLHADAGALLAPGALEGVDVPVLLAAGTDSPPVTAAILDALGARLPRAVRERIEGAGHLSAMTHPKAVAAMLDRFEAAA